MARYVSISGGMGKWKKAVVTARSDSEGSSIEGKAIAAASGEGKSVSVDLSSSAASHSGKSAAKAAGTAVIKTDDMKYTVTDAANASGKEAFVKIDLFAKKGAPVDAGKLDVLGASLHDFDIAKQLGDIDWSF